mmetsp:Transcript_11993/g.37342  ORF Transcript_11993/g.37342 Transcript_11993/m.37342 type:complete len:272 (+) Transcript_11993:34-849(+)
MDAAAAFDTNCITLRCGKRVLPPALVAMALEDIGIDGGPIAVDRGLEYHEFEDLVQTLKDETWDDGLAEALADIGLGMEGAVDEDAFCALLTTGPCGVNEAEALSLFHAIDVDRNGVLTGAELEAFVQTRRGSHAARAERLATFAAAAKCEFDEVSSRALVHESELERRHQMETDFHANFPAAPTSHTTHSEPSTRSPRANTTIPPEPRPASPRAVEPVAREPEPSSSQHATRSQRSVADASPGQTPAGSVQTASTSDPKRDNSSSCCVVA